MAAVGLLRPISLLFFSFILILFLLSPITFSWSTDSEALLKLKKSFTNAKALVDSWAPGSAPCTRKNRWVGVVCFDGNITGLHLTQMGLSGKIDIDAMLEIHGLRTISFMNNSFSGPIPEFNRIGALKAIYLSGNKFSGEIPSNYFSKMGSLKKVFIDCNRFTGKIPASLAKLPNLRELHLENNQFSGRIPAIGQTSLMSLDLSNNKLEGEIPASTSRFHPNSFSGNAGLCGERLGKKCHSDNKVVKPSAMNAPTTNAMNAPTTNGKQRQPQIAGAAVTLVVVILLLVVGAILVMRRKEDEFGTGILDEPKPLEAHGSGAVSKSADSSRRESRHNSNRGIGKMADLVVVNDEKGVFGLADLMKATAEVLGNGGIGSSYKAVMSNGVAVVVKRMREMNRLGKDGFDAELRRLGKLRHTNILAPLAYHYRKDEKLLVYEFVPKGSLLHLLHGDRATYHSELDWPARLKIVKGIAKGMDYLHTKLASLDLPHGNLKSSNVLLGSDYEPFLAEFGFTLLVSPNQAPQAMFAYKSPEAVQFNQVSPKSDVYCLGIVILEILTGKFPSQYLSNGKGGTNVVQWVSSAITEKRQAEVFDPEINAGSKNSLGGMQRLLRIGADCTETDPEQRIDMREAIRRVDEIEVEGSHDGIASPVTPVSPSLSYGPARW